MNPLSHQMCCQNSFSSIGSPLVVEQRSLCVYDNLPVLVCNVSKKKPECPLEGKCLQANVVYQASVTTEATNESYIGLATNFKDRYRNHMTSFRHANRRNETELSKYIWTLKDARKPFRVQWKVLATCKPYDNMSKKCNLCLKEKFFIICRNDLCTLNKRNELASSCPHRNRFTLKNFKI